jgi:hypothetical protein
MSVWRRKALKDFPELRQELNGKTKIESFFDVLVKLKPLLGPLTRHS